MVVLKCGKVQVSIVKLIAMFGWRWANEYGK